MKNDNKNHGKLISDVLAEKINYSWNKDIETLVRYVEKEKEAFDHITDDITKPLVIKIPPVGEVGMTLFDFDTLKFLVSLSRKKIISDLYLPVYVKRVNQQVVTLGNPGFYFSEEYALRDAMYDFKEFQGQVISFKIPHWQKFLDVKKESRLEDQTETKEAKEIICIDRENGVYRFEDNSKLSYPVKGKRYKLIRMFNDNKILGILQLSLLYGNPQITSKEIKNINDRFKQTLKLNDDLIVHLDTNGYKLNTEKFNIEYKP